MIKCTIKEQAWGQLKVKGTTHQIMLETAMLIELIHQQINNSSPEAAKEYRREILSILLAPDSPVWKEGNHESSNQS